MLYYFTTKFKLNSLNSDLVSGIITCNTPKIMMNGI